ncbi:hypothetical protein [Tepidiforma sp.]|uniref:hypothetical protein n=1 Tax=Tepidiforma sp. TaxID=2682230 RepID=UPI0021DEAE6F|nr:hypothetical protein [Tepidiforma sp.]MCX7616905.1 hypothetical protein [Tepidiforma sp.]GIW17350.1 MAG: hypothetical protein KatS3mg064_0507 [Tepidiforma sp.]
MPLTGRLQGQLFTECAEWVWEQLQDEGIQLQGELIELILETERELGLHTAPLDVIASALAEEFDRRGIVARPYPVDARVIRAVLEWEDDFLGFAGIPRAES